MKSLVDKLMILTGRKLPQPELERARQSALSLEDFGLLALNKSRFSKPFREEIFKEGGAVVRHRVFYEFATTTDVSDRNRTHSGYYPIQDETDWYNYQGLLIESRVITNAPAGRLIVYKRTQPISPGSFRKKTVESFEY